MKSSIRSYFVVSRARFLNLLQSSPKLCLFLQCSGPQAYRDSVNEVRVGASEGLQRLCKVCGADWLQEKILPRIHGFYDESTFYLIRIAILNALKKLANGEVSI